MEVAVESPVAADHSVPVISPRSPSPERDSTVALEVPAAVPQHTSPAESEHHHPEQTEEVPSSSSTAPSNTLGTDAMDTTPDWNAETTSQQEFSHPVPSHTQPESTEQTSSSPTETEQNTNNAVSNTDGIEPQDQPVSSTQDGSQDDDQTRTPSQDEDDEEEEHAHWADIEEDTSVPDEAELKEIETNDDVVSASEHQYWEKLFFKDVDDPEYKPSVKARMTWKIKGVRGTKEKPNRATIMRSPAAYIGGFYWTIKFFPRGNNVSSLSAYVECSRDPPPPDKVIPETEFKVFKGAPDAVLSDLQPDIDLTLPATSPTKSTKPTSEPKDPEVSVTETAASDDENEDSRDSTAQGREETEQQSEEKTPGDWRVSAQIGVNIYNPAEPRTGYVQSSCHQFNPHNLDWGWTNFHGPWDEIHRRQRGQRQALLRNDTLAFDAYIRVFDDPTQSLWWHRSDSEPVWDSYTLTGYRPMGDLNINYSHEVAGLASWLMLTPVRKIIQSVDILEYLNNPNVRPRPLCDALQRFLYTMRSQPSSHYVDTDPVTQTLKNLHEKSGGPVEFWERVRRTLELELDGTKALEELSQIFDSPNVPKSDIAPVNSLPKEFNSRISLPAENANSVQSAVSKYVNGKQGKWNLPPVLQIEFVRQKFDKATRAWVMLQDAVELNEEIDLDSSVPEGTEGKYTLYGFVVQKGRRIAGQFYSVLRPGGPGSRWLAFKDSHPHEIACLTTREALKGHEGGNRDQPGSVEQTGFVPVVVMYVRNDVVPQYLTGKIEPWDVSNTVKDYFDRALDSPQLVDGARFDKLVSVEIHSLKDLSSVKSSLFNSYDLMDASRQTGQVRYLTLPGDATFAELRRKLAAWMTRDNNESSIEAENIRLWHIGPRKPLFPPTLLLHRVDDLLRTVSSFSLNTLRLWVHVVSEADAKLFALPDPKYHFDVFQYERPQTVEEALPFSLEYGGQSESDTEESADDATQPTSTGQGDTPTPSGDAAQSSQPDDRAANEDIAMSDADAGETATSSTQEATATDQANASSPGTPSQESVANASEDQGEAPVTVSNGQQEVMEIVDTRQPESELPPTQQEPVQREDSVMHESPVEEPGNDTAVESRRLRIPPPSKQVYFFVQAFDPERQELRILGAFFARATDTIKSAVRTALGWPDSKQFILWHRVDEGISLTAVSDGDVFPYLVQYTNCECFVVGDVLDNAECNKLARAGSFSTPSLLMKYLWAQSRNHPTQAFSGTKTVDNTASGDYYSGEFAKGYYHGHGTHISDNGATYTGNFVFGKRQGTGQMEYPSGDTYKGDWVENERHGIGEYVERRTGNKYVGGYQNGKKHGKGVTYWEVADEEMDLCQICFSEDQDALFYSCGHVCACVSCAKQVESCPMCRKKIINVVRIFKS